MGYERAVQLARREAWVFAVVGSVGRSPPQLAKERESRAAGMELWCGVSCRAGCHRAGDTTQLGTIVSLRFHTVRDAIARSGLESQQELSAEMELLSYGGFIYFDEYDAIVAVNTVRLQQSHAASQRCLQPHCTHSATALR